MPLLVWWFKALVRGWDAEMARLPLWRIPIAMPPAYTIAYLMLLTGGIYFLPLAARHSRWLLLTVIGGVALSAAAMIPVVFVPVVTSGAP